MKITVKNRILRQPGKIYCEISDSTHRITFKWRWGKGDLSEVKPWHSSRLRKELGRRWDFESFSSLRFYQSSHPSLWYV